MSYLLACTVATLLLAAFLISSFFMHLARRVQHERFKRELAALLEERAEVAAEVGELKNLQNENAAAKLLNEAMRETIQQGLELRKIIEVQQLQFTALVAERRGQIAVEVSTLETWAKIRDDLTAWADKYPAYCFTEGGEG